MFVFVQCLAQEDCEFDSVVFSICFFFLEHLQITGQQGKGKDTSLIYSENNIFIHQKLKIPNYFGNTSQFSEHSSQRYFYEQISDEDS